jgi:hypothetical protein
MKKLTKPEPFLGLSRRSSVEFLSGRKIHRCGRDRPGARARAGGAQVNPAQRALQASERANPDGVGGATDATADRPLIPFYAEIQRIRETKETVVEDRIRL